MDVKFRQTEDSNDLDGEMASLVDALIKAYGDDLPTYIEGITDSIGRYDLHLATEDWGNAYGNCLAANGWAIVGFHTHYSDGPSVDRVSVKRIADCTNDETILYDDGDEDRVIVENLINK